MSPSTNWKEPKAADEDARFLAYAERLRALQKASAGKDSAHRALHAKGNLGVTATFVVLPDLPDHARVGLFAEPKTYRAYVRYSNGSGRVQHDKAGDVRGIAIKVLGVPGKKVIPGMEDAKTQDFLLIRSQTMPFRTVREFVEVVTAAGQSPLLLLPRIFARVGVGRAFGLLKQLQAGMGVPMSSFAVTRYYSPASMRVGEYCARFELAPHAQDDGVALEGSTADFRGEELAARLAKGSVVYDFRLQFYVNDEKTPIDDATRAWSYDDAPPVTVARLEIEKQDVKSERGKRVTNAIEKMSFDPWHALVEHRPVGEMMRARNVAYRLSTEERKAANEPSEDEALT